MATQRRNTILQRSNKLPTQLLVLSAILWPAFVGAQFHLWAAHYNRGFNGLQQPIDALTLAPVMAVATAIALVLISKQIREMHRTIRPKMLLALLAASFAAALWLAWQSFWMDHGLWQEHRWQYDGVVYRRHGFSAPAVHAGMFILAVTLLLGLLEETNTSRLWKWAAIMSPLALAALLLAMHA